MKIYILTPDAAFLPETQGYHYPPHNDDYGVEQDFYHYLLSHQELLTLDAHEADWHYLPIYWTRWHVVHQHGKEGLEELSAQVQHLVIDSKKTFTVCQNDDGPLADLGLATVFLSSRRTKNGIDIPLLSSAHNPSSKFTKKKYLASFIGNVGSHPIRRQMMDALAGMQDIYLFDSHAKRNNLQQKLLQLGLMARFGNRSNFFTDTMLRSYVALCPRGYGGSSFRFFEAMQLGVVPFLVGDIDTRPFGKYINWEQISFFTNNPKEIISLIRSKKQEELIAMGQGAKKLYQDTLALGVWCQLVIKELEAIHE